MSAGSPGDRLERHAKEWYVSFEQVVETDTSMTAYGRRDSTAVVLKVIKHAGDEWSSGSVVEAFEGRGMVHVYEHAGGALLLERLVPGSSLIELSLRGEDDSATEILIGVIRTLSPRRIPTGCPTVREWGSAFASYAASGDPRIPKPLVERARETFLLLCDTQRNPRLLHADLQHSNVLFDAERGWVAIDPKGVVGERECEIGAALRNPREAPALFTGRATIERRLDRLVRGLELDAARALAWAFAQAVLSVIWSIEDGDAVHVADPTLVHAQTLGGMLAARGSFGPRA